MIYAKEKATGKILASNSHCTAESMLSDITSDGIKAEDVVVAEASEEQIRTWIDEQKKLAMTYSDKRKAEYPSLESVTVALAEKEEGNSAMWDEITKQRQAVKAKHPKN